MEQATLPEDAAADRRTKRQIRRQRFALVAAVMATLGGIAGALDMVGSQATLARALMILAAGFAGGASLVAAIRQRKR